MKYVKYLVCAGWSGEYVSTWSAGLDWVKYVSTWSAMLDWVNYAIPGLVGGLGDVNQSSDLLVGLGELCAPGLLGWTG